MAVLSLIPLLFIFSVSTIDSFISEFMDTNHVPGLSACIVLNSDVIWSGSWGYQNIENSIPASDSTLYMMASVSKTFTGAALMQLWEDGLFKLDDPVSDYLPFTVEHVSFPGTPITFQMILTHSSGIEDNWDVMGSVYHPGDSPIPLVEFLYSYYTPGEPFYDAEKNFYNWEPGTKTSYSNMAYALMGLLVQEISGMPFDQYCNLNIFQPLGMTETSWFFSDLDSTHIAMPYHWDGDQYVPYGYFGYADYPAGQLRTSSDQLAIWLAAFLNDGCYNNYSMLDSSTVHLITTVQDSSLSPTLGFTWFRRATPERVYWEHGGADQGVRTRILFNPDRGYGIVVLTNGEAGPGPIIEPLMDYAEFLIATHGSSLNLFTEDRLWVSPNPIQGSGNVFIELSEPGEIRIELFDLSGRKIIDLISSFVSSGRHSFELNLNEYPSGILLVKLTLDNGPIYSSLVNI